MERGSGKGESYRVTTHGVEGGRSHIPRGAGSSSEHSMSSLIDEILSSGSRQRASPGGASSLELSFRS